MSIMVVNAPTKGSGSHDIRVHDFLSSVFDSIQVHLLRSEVAGNLSPRRLYVLVVGFLR